MTTSAGDDARATRSRALLLDATIRLLERGGIDAVTVDAVGAESGIARATLKRAYPTMVELIAAAFEQVLPQLQITPASRSLRADLLHLLTVHAEFFDTVPLHPTMLGWLVLNKASDGDGADSHLESLQAGIASRYRAPLVAVLNSDLARDALTARSRTGAGVEISVAQLFGPLVFNRLVTATPNTRAVCTRIVDDFLRANRIV